MINVKVGPDVRLSTWLVDSGARESVLDNESFKEKFPGTELQPLPAGMKFSQADGSPLDILGSFSTEFWFGKEPVTATVFVCRGVTRTRLIGSNILSKFPRWGVDNQSHCFTLGDAQIPLVKTIGEAPSACSVQLESEVQIPPRCSRYVTAVLPHRYNPSEFVFKPDERLFDKHKLLLPICLVANNFFDGSVVIKVSNPSDRVVMVHKGTKMGKVTNNVKDYSFISGKENVDVPKISSVQLAATTSELRDKLKGDHPELFKLYEESCGLLCGEEKRSLLEMLWKYRHVFSRDDNDIGTTTVIKHQIVPKNDKVVYRRQYKHTEEQHQQIDKEVQKLLDSGVIKESMSPYNSPVLMVPKKEAGKWRFCLDCRYINDLTEDQYFPIPRVDEVLDSLSGAEVWSVVDMTSGYHQVELTGKTSEMCAFSTRKGHFQYTKLPMGLCGSGMTFQKMVTLLLSGMLHSEVLAYLDDCILFSKTSQQHMSILEEVLRRFGEANLKLKPKKCHLFQEQIVYLGFLIDKHGIQPNPEKTRLINDLKNPGNVTEVQMFLGKANYYRKFIPKLAEIAHPLYELTQCKKGEFCWESEHQSAFDQIKSILVSRQVMGHPRLDKEFILDVDASDYALGAELSQEDNCGNIRPIYYASRHLEKSERNYSATARETLAAVFGCEYFRQYLQGRKFILRTDHNPLVWLRGMREPKRPYSGWIVRLEQFEYQMQYRPGKDHINADFNSRVRPTEEQYGLRSIGTQTDTRGSEHAANQKNMRQNLQISEVQQIGDLAESSSREVLTVSNGDDEDKELVDNADKHDAPQHAEHGVPHDDVPQFYEHDAPQQNEHDITHHDAPSAQLMKDQQLQDKDIGPVVRRLLGKGDEESLTKSGEQLWRARRKLELKDGLLIRQHKLKSGLRAIEQVVLPSCLRQIVLESLHDSPFAGHFGEKRTGTRVQLRYYWPGYLEEVSEWCKTCDVCQKRKNPKSKNVAPLKSINTGEGPFEQIALDILKLPVTARGNQYLLVVEDFFSKWIEAFPLERTVAPSVAQCVLNGWITRFGCPYTILSDQGREFESKLFKSLNAMLQTKKLRTTTYHPRTDGMVERSNRTVIDILSKYCEGESDWDLKMPLALFAIRTSEHTTTGFSPFSLIYGREARIPWDIVYGSAPNTLMPLEKWVAERKANMTKVFKLVQDHTKKRQMQQKKYFDNQRRGVCQSFDPGELVMMFDPACRSKVGKLNNPWSGPYQIVDKLSDALYKVKIAQDKQKVVNVERLKKYYQRGRNVVEKVDNHDEEGYSTDESELEAGDISNDEEEVQQPDYENLVHPPLEPGAQGLGDPAPAALAAGQDIGNPQNMLAQDQQRGGGPLINLQKCRLLLYCY